MCVRQTVGIRTDGPDRVGLMDDHLFWMERKKKEMEREGDYQKD